MRFGVILAVLVLVVTESFAQRDPDKLFYARKVEKYRKMKSAGALLTITGGILFAVGVGVISNSTVTTSGNTTTTTGDPDLGLACLALGASGLGAGLPLWIISARKQKRNQNFFDRTTVGFNVNPRYGGLKFAYRF